MRESHGARHPERDPESEPRRVGGRARARARARLPASGRPPLRRGADLRRAARAGRAAARERGRDRRLAGARRGGGVAHRSRELPRARGSALDRSSSPAFRTPAPSIALLGSDQLQALKPWFVVREAGRFRGTFWSLPLALLAAARVRGHFALHATGRARRSLPAAGRAAAHRARPDRDPHACAIRCATRCCSPASARASSSARWRWSP